MSNRIHAFIIDGQNDFCTKQEGNHKGALYVQGADDDMKRVSGLIRRLGRKIDAITVTLDSHHVLHIAHPIMWINTNGENPKPFTIISADDVNKGVWRASMPQFVKRQREYVQKLATNARYPLCIWPPHCLIGTWGHSLYEEFSNALIEWETSNIRMVDKVTKGSNLMTEHYSVFMADVPDPSDPSTQLNVSLIDSMKNADDILIGGEALDFCIRNSITDLANNFGEDNIKKFILLTDCTSSVNVPGLENLGPDFIKDMTARGMRVTTSVDYLA